VDPPLEGTWGPLERTREHGLSPNAEDVTKIRPHPESRQFRGGECPRLQDGLPGQPLAGSALLLPVRISDELFFAVICVDDLAAARGALGGHVINE
jgi:hypothetical protein